MHATVTTWRLHESIREADAYDAFLREMVNRNIEVARQAGMVDSVLIRVEPDTLIGVSVYETEDDAAAAGPVARQVVGNFYADRLEFISRVAGRMDDMPSLPGRDAAAIVSGAAPIHASVTSWRLHESLRDEHAYTAFLAKVMEQNLALAREIGLLDVMIVRASDDTITSIGMYKTPEAARAAIERSTTVYNERYTAVLELLERKTGRADDIPRLIGRLD